MMQPKRELPVGLVKPLPQHDLHGLTGRLRSANPYAFSASLQPSFFSGPWTGLQQPSICTLRFHPEWTQLYDDPVPERHVSRLRLQRLDANDLGCVFDLPGPIGRSKRCRDEQPSAERPRKGDEALCNPLRLGQRSLREHVDEVALF